MYLFNQQMVHYSLTDAPNFAPQLPGLLGVTAGSAIAIGVGAIASAIGKKALSKTEMDTTLKSVANAALSSVNTHPVGKTVESVVSSLL